MILVAVRPHVRGAGGGVPVTTRIMHVWRHADLLGLDLRVFPDEQTAREVIRQER